MGTFILVVVVIIAIGSFLTGVTDRNKSVKDYNNLRKFEEKQIALEKKHEGGIKDRFGNVIGSEESNKASERIRERKYQERVQKYGKEKVDRIDAIMKEKMDEWRKNNLNDE